MKAEFFEKLNTKIIGQNAIFLEEIGSTQDYVKDANKQGAPNGLVVVANNQTQGQGTKGRIWYSEKDVNLTFSFLLIPECNVKKIEHLTVIVAKTMVNVIKELYDCQLEIKFPNDLMINGKKCGGILTEAISANEEIKSIVIGIGLNVNQVNCPKEIENIATSMKKEFKKEFNRGEILAQFFNEFEKEYRKLLDTNKF